VPRARYAGRAADRDERQGAHRNEGEGRGKGKGEGGFTSTGADELRASSKSAIRFSLRGVERERSFGLSREERRPVSLTRRPGRGCCDGWCVRQVGGAGARLLGGPDAQGAGGERSRCRSRLGRVGKSPRWAARAGASAGPRGRQASPRRERGEKGGKRQAGPRQGSRPKRGEVFLIFFLAPNSLNK
jgi:hypothetical protein